MRAFNVAAPIRNPPETVTREHSDDNTVGEDADGSEVSCYQPVDREDGLCILDESDDDEDEDL